MIEMSELLAWLSTLGPKDYVLGLLVFFGVSVLGMVCVLFLSDWRRSITKRALPHTMSNDEYAQLNDKRMGE